MVVAVAVAVAAAAVVAVDGDGDGGNVHADVVDALGWCALSARSPILEGSVPLRVAQACTPLLEGNAYGLQLTLRAPLVVERGLVSATTSLGAAEEHLWALWRGALPRLIDEGLVRGPWQQELARGLVRATGRASSRFWTGLLLRPQKGLWLRVTQGANRRALSYSVGSVVIADPEAFVPLFVDVSLSPRTPRAVVDTECATLGVMRPGLPMTRVPLAARPEIGRAHLAFYDDAYFAQKKGQPTRKYARTIARRASSSTHGSAGDSSDQENTSDKAQRADVHIDEGAVIVEVGPCPATVTPLASGARVFLPEGETHAVPARLGELHVVTFPNMVPLSVNSDGLRINVNVAEERRAAHAAALFSTWRAALGDDAVDGSKGALLYFTKYVNHHPPGEPHFFVKPFALTKTPPSWSCLLEGIDGADIDEAPYDIWRGVVRTDAFHATPAVFHLWKPVGSFVVPEGRPLLRLIPLPRSLQAPRVTLRLLDGVTPLQHGEEQT